MKKLVFVLAIFGLSQVFMLTFSQAFAQDENSKPCLEVKKACESAGFMKGKHKEGKGLFKDCMQKLSNGETVEGVSISADAIAACKDKRVGNKDKK